MNFIDFIKDYKNKEINKDELIKLLKEKFKNIKIDDDNYNLIITLDNYYYQVEYTHKNDNSKNIIILNTSTIDQVLPMHKL